MERVKEILRIIISPSGATIAICATLIILRNSINGLTERLITSRRGKAKFGPVEVDFEEPPEQIQRDVPKSKEPEPESSKETETPVTEQEAKPLLNQVFDLLYAENNYQEAQKFFHEQVEPKLDEDEKLVWKAVILRISSEIGDSNALDKLKTIVKENETNPKLIRQLALRYRDMGLFEKSKEQFLLAKDNLDINDKSQRDLIVDCYIGSSMCLANNNEYIDAINMLKQTLRKNEFQAQRAKILRAMANIAKDNNESDDFICYAELALNTNPLDIDIRFSIAYVYNEMGNGKLALLHYKQLLDISTNHAVALNNLGVCYSNLKLKAKSINSYLRSAEEKETLAMSNLAFNYLDAGFIKNAKELIDRANKLSAEGIEVNPRIGSVSGKLKDLKEEEEKGETKFLKEAERERKFRLKYSEAKLSEKTISKSDLQGPWDTPWGEAKIILYEKSESFKINLHTKEEDKIASALSHSLSSSYGFAKPAKIYKERYIVINGSIIGLTSKYSIQIDDTEKTTILGGGKIYNATGYMIINESCDRIEIMEKTSDDKTEFKEWIKVDGVEPVKSEVKNSD